MNMEIAGKSEHIIQNIVGCGSFQVILVTIVLFVTKSASCFSMMFMSFGNFNPGWRCLDSNGTTFNESLTNTSSGEYVKDNCPVFDSCTKIEFDPGTSTIVSEWGLLCGNAYIPSTIISVQMAGLFIGCSVAGCIGDAIGRRTTIYIGQAILIVGNVVIIFSSSWQMFAALRFIIGVGMSLKITLYYIYIAEFVTKKWRAVLPNIPFWPFLSIVFAITCMILKDWRQIHMVTAGLALIGLIPVLWVPESLRWLEVKNKIDRFNKTAKQIAKWNRKTLPPLESIKVVETNQKTKGNSGKVYTFLDLFRPGYKMYTILLAIPWVLMNIIYYAIAFGVKAFSGNLYLNMIIMYATEIPFTFIPMLAPNVLGRKKASLLFASVSGTCLLLAAFLHQFTTGNSKITGVVVLANIGRVTVGFFWGMMQAYTAEIYPTVVRGLGTSWGNSWARFGGIAAPFLIPNEPSMFFLCYIIMGILALICCGVITRFPETRGKPLQETFATNNSRMLHEENHERELNNSQPI